jgi:hypothetical protein
MNRTAHVQVAMNLNVLILQLFQFLAPAGPSLILIT